MKRIPESITKLFKTSRTKDNDFILPTINTEYKHRFVSFSAVKQWKIIPKDIKNSVCMSSFKNSYIKHLNKLGN